MPSVLGRYLAIPKFCTQLTLYAESDGAEITLAASQWPDRLANLRMLWNEARPRPLESCDLNPYTSTAAALIVKLCTRTILFSSSFKSL